MFFINPLNVLRILTEYYEDDFKDKTDRISFREQELANTLREMLDHCLKHADLVMETGTDLDFEAELANYEVSLEEIAAFVDEEEEDEKENAIGQLELFSQHSDYQPTPPNRSYDLIELDYKKKAVDYWLNINGKQRPLVSVLRKFRKVKNRQNLLN
ncbi:hypothetical protein BV898_12844 [Hypsibius exemplaris]|uniref:Uncharacterized protein n=1 Tax=Hypsibius exemplaris TaxID=2072580 RepID=A0A1W0WCP0_HYPEX|nr:hypothetical protein BV898_12844 [Hypsibius exemplaris]